MMIRLRSPRFRSSNYLRMAREKWLIDPAELDEFQIGIRELDIDDSYIVKGCAGSGKTILALYRANDIRIDAIASGRTSSFSVVVFTKALRSFIRSAIQDLGIDLHQVIHYEKWDGNAVDYIVIDEAQDFSTEKITVCKETTRKSMMLYGDSQQRLYPGGLPLEEIATMLGIVEKELLKNYRLPKLVADFASFLGEDRDLASKCMKAGSEKPRILRFDSWQEELDFIMEEIRTRNYTDVAILLPFNNKLKAPKTNFHRNVETVKEYFDSSDFTHEFKMRKDEHDTIDLDFDSELPKVMSFHSSKGLQFETVFIPFIDYPDSQWFAEEYKKPLYVAATRTYRNLYLSHSSGVNELFKIIPPTKYDSRK